MNGSGPWLPAPHVGLLHAAGLLRPGSGLAVVGIRGE